METLVSLLPRLFALNAVRDRLESIKPGRGIKETEEEEMNAEDLIFAALSPSERRLVIRLAAGLQSLEEIETAIRMEYAELAGPELEPTQAAAAA